MQIPLTPLEFMRRARRLYAGRDAVVNDAVRWTYAQFFERCDRWSAALQALGIKNGDRVASSRPTRTRSSRRSTPCRRSAPCSFQSTSALSAEDSGIDRTQRRYGAVRRCPYSRRHRRHSRQAARRASLRRADGRSRDGRITRRWSRVRWAIGSGRHRQARSAHDRLQRHHVAAERRDDHAPERVGEHHRHARPRADERWPIATCGRYRCSTPTAGRSRGS